MRRPRRSGARPCCSSKGGSATRSEGWREDVLQALAMLEASLDFSDEADVPDWPGGRYPAAPGGSLDGASAHLASRSGERLREGLMVVLAGAPNAGKSTLLNALARRDVAIVSPIAGTTRDVIEVRCDLGGLPVTIVDTAGLRESADLDRAGRRGAGGGARPGCRHRRCGCVAPDDSEASCRLAGACSAVGTKADLNRRRDDCDLVVSATTGDGIPELLVASRRRRRRLLGTGADALLTRERHRAALEDANASLTNAIEMLRRPGPLELPPRKLAWLRGPLGRMTGRVDVEDVLDRLFSSFCIGK